LGESVNEATIAKWLKQPGDAVAQDDALVELETDKVTLEVNAPSSGILSEILVPEGANVAVGAVLGRIGAGAASPKPAAPKPVPAKQAATSPATPPPDILARSGPAVRRIVEEKQIDVAAIKPSREDGRLTKGEVLGSPRPAVPVPPPPGAVRPTGMPREERVRMTRLRHRIAERLKEAQNNAAMLTTFNEVDMTAVMALRERYRESFEKRHGVRLGFMSLFVKASIAALKEIPAVNAVIEGDEIVYKHYYDISVAVSTEQGLVVPVVRDADRLSFAEIEKAIAELGRKARDGKLALADLAGGTFTISNGGIYGSLMSTPILNPPQSGILGMHKIEKRPMVVNDRIEARPMMYLALSYDHRLVDGREAVTFLVRVKECIEDPERMLFDV
ncbi:MAG TPA: 2-oxoglutarate dehydrogenase complex dihydrolipoyllysine-residue succinyltransferase, partial [Stellaceae bacterium]|nr:2-oxoglutarate dehydrogenase complex dihydrolipoyllysine-residue succinyltransferase [Stellaceae bacterium]